MQRGGKEAGATMIHVSTGDSSGLRRRLAYGSLLGGGVLSLALVFGLSMGAAAPRTPLLRPVFSASLPGLADADSRRLAAGFAAGAAGRWDEARDLATQIRDPLARKVLEWRVLTADNSAPTFFELERGIDEFAGWPGALSIRTRAEQSAPFALNGAEAQRFLLDSGPKTSLGRAALALAQERVGEHDKALDLARKMWRAEPLDSLTETRLLAVFGAALTPEDHAVRAQLLLWRGDEAGAKRLFPRLSDSERAIDAAWLALDADARDANLRLAALSADGAGRPGILFERARRARRADDVGEALRLMARIDPDAVPLNAREIVWEERKNLVNAALRMGQGAAAYPIAAAHGLSAGVVFADAEWTAGWLALRQLHDPARAAAHFATLESKVGAAVSLARARYWRAEALDAGGDQGAAQIAFAAAAEFPTTFYGQLAIARGGLSRQLLLPTTPPPTPEQRAAFNARDEVRAIRMLNALGEQGPMRLFFLALDDRLDSAQDHALLAELAETVDAPSLGVRTAKSGLARGLIAEAAAFPLPDLPAAARNTNYIEPAVVLAITRQETEFDPHAVSQAGARGLMQLLPSTAAAVARKLGLAFKTAWLTEKPDYNLTIGAAHLDELAAQFNGSYILAIAAYNAGATRSRQWIATYGDPRSKDVDPVDWIESIPFAETRNYVQRVIENIEVYRTRLAGGASLLRIDQDLRRGAPGP